MSEKEKENSDNIDLLEEICKQSVGSVFTKIALLHPEKIAVEFEKEKISYKELEGRSGQISQYLRNCSVEKGDYVGVCVDKSIDFIAWLIAVLKCGGVYVPLDPKLPKNRMETIIADTKMKFLVTSDTHQESFKECFKGRIIVISEFRSGGNIYQCPTLDGEDLCACFFTSGSTGQPKGVRVANRNIIHLGLASYEHMNLRRDVDSYANFASAIFVVSLSDIFTPLLNGMTLVIVPEEFRKKPFEIAKFINQKKVTCLHIPPAMLKLIPRDVNTFSHNLTFLRVSGEECDYDSMKYWSECPKVKNFYNSYGQTETVSTCLVKRWSSKDECSNIGVNCGTSKCYILNDHREVVPKNVVGELHVEGLGVSKGYLNRPNQQKLKYLKKSISGRDLTLLKTGDLCKYNDEGDIVYVGRMDFQVKIRGFRMNLLEIEYLVKKNPNTKDDLWNSVVGLKEDQLHNKRLVCYLILRNNIRHSFQEVVEETKKYLLDNLMDYMVPNNYIDMRKYLPPTPSGLQPKFPSTVSGKIDRNALAKLVNLEDFSENDRVLPRNKTEVKVAKIWGEVLNIIDRPLGVFDDFFELGGNSLLINIVTQKVNEAFNKRFRVPIFLQSSHINIDLMSKIIVTKEEQNKQKYHLIKLIREFTEKGEAVDWNCEPPIQYKLIDLDDEEEVEEVLNMAANVVSGALDGYMGEPFRWVMNSTVEIEKKFLRPYVIAGGKRKLVVVSKNRKNGEVLGAYIMHDNIDKFDLPEEILESYAPDKAIINKVEGYALEDIPKEKKICHVCFNVGMMKAPPSMSLIQLCCSQEMSRLAGYDMILSVPSSPITQMMLDDLGWYTKHKKVIFSEFKFKGECVYRGLKEKYFKKMLEEGYMSQKEIEKLEYEFIRGYSRPLDKPVWEILFL